VAKRRKKRKPEPAPKKYSTVPFEIRARIVEAALRGTRHADIAATFGVSSAVVGKYLALFSGGGVDALRPRKVGYPSHSTTSDAKRTALTAARGAVVAAREQNPDWGAWRIRDALARPQRSGSYSCHPDEPPTWYLAKDSRTAANTLDAFRFEEKRKQWKVRGAAGLVGAGLAVLIVFWS
jgi:hypothetical protein